MVTRAKTFAQPHWRKDLQWQCRASNRRAFTGEVGCHTPRDFPQISFGGPQVDEVTLLAGVIRISKSESTVS